MSILNSLFRFNTSITNRCDIFKKPQITRIKRSAYPSVLLLWEESVRSSHHFLAESDIQDYKLYISPEYLHTLKIYALIENSEMKGFVGILKNKIQLLFIAPKYFYKGYGKKLLHFAIHKKGITEVDVNAQNTNAYSFYLKAGFKIIEKHLFDAAGKAYPVWSLQLENT